MKTKSMFTKILMIVASALMLAAVGGGNAYAGYLTDGSEGPIVGFGGLPGIVNASFPNFENTVNVKVQKNGSKGFKLKVRKSGKGSYFNLSGSESLKIKNGKYFLDAYFDKSGGFLRGDLEIKGKLATSSGKATGTLMTAKLGDFAFTSTLLGFNTHNIRCASVINKLIGGDGCTTDESVIINLQDAGFNPTLKGFNSEGLSVASVPVPAAVWLFGSGLIALAGVTRRRKH